MKLITPSGAKHLEQKGKGEKKEKKGNINGQCSLLHALINRGNARTVYPTRYIIRHHLLPPSYSEVHKAHAIPLTLAKCK